MAVWSQSLAGALAVLESPERLVDHQALSARQEICERRGLPKARRVLARAFQKVGDFCGLSLKDALPLQKI